MWLQTNTKHIRLRLNFNASLFFIHCFVNYCCILLFVYPQLCYVHRDAFKLLFPYDTIKVEAIEFCWKSSIKYNFNLRKCLFCHFFQQNVWVFIFFSIDFFLFLEEKFLAVFVLIFIFMYCVFVYVYHWLNWEYENHIFLP